VPRRDLGRGQARAAVVYAPLRVCGPHFHAAHAGHPRRERSGARRRVCLIQTVLFAKKKRPKKRAPCREKKKTKKQHKKTKQQQQNKKQKNIKNKTKKNGRFPRVGGVGPTVQSPVAGDCSWILSNHQFLQKTKNYIVFLSEAPFFLKKVLSQLLQTSPLHTR
jgi:hypothetical protein